MVLVVCKFVQLVDILVPQIASLEKGTEPIVSY